MRALAIAYEPDSGPGVFAEAAEDVGVELEIWSRWKSDSPPEPIESYGAAICLGGSMHPVGPGEEEAQLTADRSLLSRAIEEELPVLGVCLGAELCAQARGGRVTKLPTIEVGWAEIRLTDQGVDDPLIGPMGESFIGFEWHSYGCEIPEGCPVLASSEASPQAWRLGPRAWAIQFHAEVTLEDALSWLGSWSNDPDAVASGLDPDEIERQTRERIETWNELGRGLARRFLEIAATGD